MFDFGCQYCRETHEAANIEQRQFNVIDVYEEKTAIWIDLCDFCWSFAPKMRLYSNETREDMQWSMYDYVKRRIKENIEKAKMEYFRKRFVLEVY